MILTEDLDRHSEAPELLIADAEGELERIFRTIEPAGDHYG